MKMMHKIIETVFENTVVPVQKVFSKPKAKPSVFKDLFEDPDSFEFIIQSNNGDIDIKVRKRKES